MREDLLVQSRFRNAVLYDALAGRSVAEVCREIGDVTQSAFGELLNLKASPFTKSTKGPKNKPEFRTVALRIAAYFRMLPEDLFPESLYSIKLPAGVNRYYECERVVPLLKSHSTEPHLLTDGLAQEEFKVKINDLIDTLAPREAEVIRLRFGLGDGSERTLEEIAQRFQVTRERIRQIENKALRHLRHPTQSKLIRQYANS